MILCDMWLLSWRPFKNETVLCARNASVDGTVWMGDFFPARFSSVNYCYYFGNTREETTNHDGNGADGSPGVPLRHWIQWTQRAHASFLRTDNPRASKVDRWRKFARALLLCLCPCLRKSIRHRVCTCTRAFMHKCIINGPESGFEIPADERPWHPVWRT